jgi:mannose-6-phosphate isomerase-like protein (cupin superfamily)
MPEILDPHVPCEQFDVFQVAQITRGTPMEHTVAVDVVFVPPGKSSEIHRHNGTDSVLYILEGSGTVIVGESSLEVRKGARIFIGKGVYHGVRTEGEGEGLSFLSVQSPPILDKERGRLDLEPLGT